METPNLTEPGIKYWLSQSLREMRHFKNRNLTIIFNFTMTIALIIVISGFLLFKYKGKLTPQEIAVKQQKKKEYLISKLVKIGETKRKIDETMITDLPVWSNHPEVEILDRKIYT
ncbi:MAG: hypothetical protein CMI79_05440 [Candidatus Pelagibacter sp.]|nr:hypothetical protein [Candidatus Pelagibacter sp.]|tara:strand:- start:11770 stop:12114 length:345 start_codon:yes stop_codon:yes gene_type:complete